MFRQESQDKIEGDKSNAEEEMNGD